MFYCDSVLSKKGPLANIWLAAHWDRRLTKAQIVQTKIDESVNDILSGRIPNMALRLSGQLLLGVSKIYDRKARYLLEDCSDAVVKIKISFKPGAQVDMPAEQAKASAAAITVSAALDVDKLMMPELDLNLDEILKEATAMNVANNNNKNTFMGKKGLMDMPSEIPSHVGFGPVEDVGEFEMDIEVGRRLTDQSGRPSDLLSVEQGRRESMALSDRLEAAMQFSPLRTPQKSGAADPLAFDDDGAPMMMDDDYGFMAPDVETPNRTNQNDGQDVMSPVSDQVELVKTPKRKNQRKTKMELVLDEQIDISQAEHQAQIRHLEDILMDPSLLDYSQGDFGPKAKNPFSSSSILPELNGNLFAELFNSKPDTKNQHGSNRRNAKKQETATIVLPEEENFAPQMDDDYGFMAPDANDEMAFQPVENDENQVPEMNNNNASGLQSPMKRLSISSGASQTFSRSTLQTLEIWKDQFSQAKGKPLDLEKDLMAAMSDNETVITKQVAAAAFFETLVLRGKGLIRVAQAEAYSPITLTSNPGLFTTTIQIE